MKLSIEKLKEIEEVFGDFEVGQVLGGSNDVYLRFGYWRRVDYEKLTKILGQGIKVSIDDDYDEDCGWKYSYKIKHFFRRD